MIKLIIIFWLFTGSEVFAQVFSKELLTLKIKNEQITIIARLDYSTIQHFGRDFILSNSLSLIKIKPKINRLLMYGFIFGFELGQRKVDLIDMLAGLVGVELNLLLRRFFKKSSKPGEIEIVPGSFQRAKASPLRLTPRAFLIPIAESVRMFT